MASTIDPALAGSLQEAGAALIDSIRRAIHDFYAAPPAGWQAWELWRKPEPWETRVLPNLEDYQRDIQSALRAHRAGDIKPITRAAANYGGLSKDLEFDMAWRTEQNRLAVEQAARQVVRVADRIHRLGYEELEKAGRLT